MEVDFLVWGRTTYIQLLREQVPLKKMDKEIPTKYNPIPPKGTWCSHVAPCLSH